MAWTYSGNPGSNAKDAVRFLIGDTDQDDPLLLDGEITYLLGMYNNAPLNAAIRACEAVQAKFARLANERVGQVSIDFNQKAKAYAVMRDDLTRRLAVEDSSPYAGGISVADKEQQAQNTDRVKPDFTKQMMDNDQTSPFVIPQLDPQAQGGEGG